VLVGRNCLIRATEPAKQIGARRMREVILAELASAENRIDECQSGRGTVAHRNGRRAIQLDDGRRLETHQHVVETDDLAPVR